MSNRWHREIAAAGMVLGLLAAGPALAEWSDDPTARTPICTADNTQESPRLVKVEDGFIVSWRDWRRLEYLDVYAQKFSILGEMLWPHNGRVIAEGPAGMLEQAAQVNTGLAPDGDGGALIAWNDAILPAYYLQGFVTKAEPDATVAWGDPGEPIQVPDTAVPMLSNPVRGANPISEYGIVADSEGGIFVPVHSSLGRFDSEGRLRTEWFNHSRDFNPYYGIGLGLVPVVEPGGQDGLIAVWIDGSGDFVDSISAHKFIDPETSWPGTTDSIQDAWGEVLLYDPVTTISAWRLKAVPDGSGGVIAAWIDSRTGSFRVYAQRVDSEGNVLWGESGVELSGDINFAWPSRVHAVPDNEGGAVIVWNDFVEDSARAQRIAGDGNVLWASGGVMVNGTGMVLNDLARASDGNFIMLYSSTSNSQPLVAQKLEKTNGDLLWGLGRIVSEGQCIDNYTGNEPAKLVSDGQAGAIAVFATCGWEPDIYAHRVEALLLPELDIQKLTNGRQADSADDYDVPRVAPGATVSWIYEVTNTGDVAFPAADVLVSDSQTGVTPVLDVASDDGDLILSPDETWIYTASAPALDLALPPGDITIVPGCNDGRNTYENIGRVDVAGTSVFDEDSSHYCNMGDVDGDGVTDSADNCMLEPNGPLIPDPGGNSQLDTDGDDYGNLCDPDFDNNLIINAADLAYLKTRFFTNDPDADLNGSGIVNAADLAIIKIMFFGPPGPSGLVP